MPNDGLLFILVGPSGAGKNTLMRRVQPHFDDLPQLATATTRAMRPGEQQHKEHLFVSHDEFQRMIARDELVEYKNVHQGDWYGTPRQTLERAFAADQDLIADIECLGALDIRADYPDNTVLIFVSPSSMDVLAERIRMRGNVSDQELRARLTRARFEMAYARFCDYLVINDVVEPAAEHLRQIIISERVRRRGGAAGDVQVLSRPRFHCAVSALLVYGERILISERVPEITLPTFPLPVSGDRSPADHLAEHLEAFLGTTVAVEAIVDDRFPESAPHHTALAALPYDVFLYYTFKCPVSAPLPQVEGWTWRSINDLVLSRALLDIVTAPPLQPHLPPA